MLCFQCRRDNKPLGPYLKIYRKDKCKQCGSKAVTTRMGDNNDRLTSFCEICQTNEIKSDRYYVYFVFIL